MPDLIVLIAFLVALFVAFAMGGCTKSRQEDDAQQLAARVQTEFLHAWKNYECRAHRLASLRATVRTNRARLSSASRDRGVHLLSLSLHRRPGVSADGQENV